MTDLRAEGLCLLSFDLFASKSDLVEQHIYLFCFVSNKNGVHGLPHVQHLLYFYFDVTRRDFFVLALVFA